MAVLHLAVGGFERRGGLGRGRGRWRSATMRRARSTSFSLPAETSTMRFPKVRPRRTMTTVEMVLSTSFWAEPGLQAGGAGDDLGADHDLDGVVGGAGEPASRGGRRGRR